MTQKNEKKQYPRLADHKRILDLLAVGPHIYQPLYNYPHIVPSPLRGCEDRCIEVQSAMGNVQGKRILDIGCSLGYNSLYFAERGAIVTGVDMSARNIEICQGIQGYTKGTANFSVDKFDEDYINSIPKDRHDAAFVFSVLHHVIEEKGLKAVQKMVAELIKRIPELYVELAIAHEDPDEKYQVCFARGLPEDELEVFADCPDVKVELIGRFPSHVSDLLRPIYRVVASKMTL